MTETSMEAAQREMSEKRGIVGRQSLISGGSVAWGRDREFVSLP